MKKHVKFARQLRKRMTPGEVALWQRVRRRQLGFRVRRQHPIPPYIVDFYVPFVRFIIEIDGSSHDTEEQGKRDKVRQDYLESQGFKILRFSEGEARNKTDGVIYDIQIAVEWLKNR